MDISTLFANRSRETLTKVEILMVPDSGFLLWGKRHEYALLKICYLYKVSHICIYNSDVVQNADCLQYLARENCGTIDSILSYSYLPYLKTITVECHPENLSELYYLLVRNSRIRELHFRLVEHNLSDDVYAHAGRLLNNLDDDNILEENFSIREVSIIWRRLENPVLDCLTHLSEVYTVKSNNLHRILDRNKLVFQKCKTATVIILGIRKRKVFSSRRDILSIVATMIWETKGTKIWINEEHSV